MARATAFGMCADRGDAVGTLLPQQGLDLGEVPLAAEAPARGMGEGDRPAHHVLAPPGVVRAVGERLDGEVARLVDDPAPELAGLPPALVARVGPQHEQQAQHGPGDLVGPDGERPAGVGPGWRCRSRPRWHRRRGPGGRPGEWPNPARRRPRPRSPSTATSPCLGPRGGRRRSRSSSSSRARNVRCPRPTRPPAGAVETLSAPVDPAAKANRPGRPSCPVEVSRLIVVGRHAVKRDEPSRRTSPASFPSHLEPEYRARPRRIGAVS